jgi:ABC-type transport system involved in multi-copper enzyme maturation permease subunit
MNMKIIKVLLLDTIIREYRSKTLLFFLGLTVFLIIGINLGLNYLMEVIPANMLPVAKISENSMLIFSVIIQTWNYFLSVIIGVNCVRGDFNNGVIDQILSFPIQRWEYLLGRILGAWLIVWGYYFVSFSLAEMIFSTSAGGFNFGSHLFISLIVTGLTILASVTLSCFMSIYLTKIKCFVLSFIFYGFFRWGVVISGQEDVLSYFKDIGFFKGVAAFLYLILPRIGVVDQISFDILLQRALNLNLWAHSSHFILALSVLFIVQVVLFNRKDIHY